MGKKDKELMKRQKEQFLAGVKAAKTVAAPKAGKLFDQIQEFAEYCFNKSHSAAQDRPGSRPTSRATSWPP